MQEIFVPLAVLIWGIAWIGLHPWESHRTPSQVSTPPSASEELFHPNAVHPNTVYKASLRQRNKPSAKRESHPNPDLPAKTSAANLSFP